MNPRTLHYLQRFNERPQSITFYDLDGITKLFDSLFRERNLKNKHFRLIFVKFSLLRLGSYV